MAQESWKVDPGRRPGPAIDIGVFLDRAYQADEWVRETYRYEPPDQRVTKGRFCERLHISRPTVNKYLQGGGIPFPLPPRNHVLWLVDGEDDRTLRWVNPKLCDVLQRDRDFFVGKSAHVALMPSQPRDLRDMAGLEAVRRGDIDSYETVASFDRADGLLVPLRITVYYGELYRVWFMDAQVDGDPTVPLDDSFSY